MTAIHMVRHPGGWSVRRPDDEPPALLIERKTEALRVAQGIARRYPDAVIYMQENSEGEFELVPPVQVRRRPFCHRPN